MDSCIISLSTEVSQGRGKGRETLGVDMFSYEIGDSGHASGFPLKKKKKRNSLVPVVQKTGGEAGCTI